MGASWRQRRGVRLLVSAFIVAAMLFDGFSPAPAAAKTTTISDPVRFVTSVYDKLAKDDAFSPSDDIYTPRLAALFALDRREAGDGVGRIDFDFWTNAQDWKISGLKVASSPVEGSKARRIVVAKFNNVTRPTEIHFYFESTKQGWLLDDARSTVGERWTLSLILKYGFD